jgi:hypothetical protein
MRDARKVVFEANQRVREGTQGHRNMPCAEHMLRIPEQDYYALLRLFPNLNNNRDAMAREDEWKRFMVSPLSEPYRVSKVSKGIRKQGVILKPIRGNKQ